MHILSLSKWTRFEKSGSSGQIGAEQRSNFGQSKGVANTCGRETSLVVMLELMLLFEVFMRLSP